MTFFRRLLPYAAAFLIVQTLLRASLLLRAHLAGTIFTAADILNVYARGAWFDLIVIGFFLLPAALFLLCAPRSPKAEGVFRFLFLYGLLFDAVAEHIFWGEFDTRFNFIAVDYLVYTQEVIGNIVESYPLGTLLSLIGLGALVLTWISFRLQGPRTAAPDFRKRAAGGFIALALVATVLVVVSSPTQTHFGDNAEAQEISGNGLYDLFSAFRNNEIDYNRFYAVRPEGEVIARARKLLAANNARFTTKDGADFTRIVRNAGAEQHKNVMIIVMESMSADYMGLFGNTGGLTPNLDRLAHEGLSFSDTYATGTRTVRGLEAVTLSIPPTPGQSIVRRPGNEDLFSLGSVFGQRGYDTRFLYGGHGYFDNMSAFFSGNHFDVVDRMELADNEVSFSNIWGACDEDIFHRAVKDGDTSFKAHKPFLHVIMTTSNHRPYTYPDGRIDILSKSGRNGGVKYADYSVGRLIAEAKTKPWFKDTVFIFVADHTAGAGGKTELDPHKYHIPMIFYAPQIIKPRDYKEIASQLDIAPTLLGVLHFSYASKFYGTDLLNAKGVAPHAFISNYQKVALIKGGNLTILEPQRKTESLSWPEENPVATPDPALLSDTIAYYQSASWWREHYRAVDTVVK